MKRKPKKLTIDTEELTLAKLAGEFQTTLKVHLEPSKPDKKKKGLTSAQRIRQRAMELSKSRSKNFERNPYDALTHFDVTITGQLLDIPLKLVYRKVMVGRVDSLVADAGDQLQWVVFNRLQELKMKYDYEKPLTIKIDKDML